MQASWDKAKGELRFKLYGTSDGRKMEFEGPFNKDYVPPPEPRYQDDPTLPRGEVKQKERAITGVTISGKPVVSFYLTDSKGRGLKGLGGFTSKASTASQVSYPNLSFALAKLVPEDVSATSTAPTTTSAPACETVFAASANAWLTTGTMARMC